MKTSAPLSRVQYGLYVECASHHDEPCYNIPYLYTFSGELSGERLRKAVETAVAAHPTLFTRIVLTQDGEPLQTIDDTETFELAIENTDDIEAVASRFVQPFDLTNDRLFRIRLLKDANHFYLLQDIHHIISDGTSRKVLLNDIEKAYRGEPLEPETVTQGNVATAEEHARNSKAFEDDKRWYSEHFDCGDCYTLLLPDTEGLEPIEGTIRRVLKVRPDVLETYCKSNGLYKSTLFTAAYSYLLAKFNNEQEVVFSTIHNGRADKRLAHTVAMLVKTLPVYAKFTVETTVIDFLKAQQEQMTGCRQHEVYAYSDAVTDLGIQAATMFAWHGTLFETEQLCNLPMTARRLNCNTREGLLYVKAFSMGDSYCVEAEYSADKYSEVLIAQFLESYEAVVDGLLTQRLLHDINITTEAQIATLDNFNVTDADYDNSQTIVSLFCRQAKESPDNIAVVYKDKRYTYSEVDALSNGIAAFIANKGLGAEDVVSVLIPRCEWMAIVSLGVLKAGCAYQPLDPTYPKDRLNFMMRDANAKYLIVDEDLRSIVDEYDGGVLLTRDLKKLSAAEFPQAEIKPEDLFILLYTSGSTGVPKGCQLTHANLVAFCHWYQRYYDLQPHHRVAAYASYGFDASMMDMYPALTCGATVHIIPEEIRLDLIALNDYFEANGITHSFMTTQVGYQFVTGIANHSLMHLSVGGEKLAAITPPQNYKLHNGYGPTECSIFTTTYPLDKKMMEIPIGKALDNMHLYVVDQQGRRLPVGAAGELWVSGPQVSRGYLNRPDKTAEVYIPNPFCDEKKYSRVYRTGDIVRYLPSGDIQFVGRRDGQVKIRGFRIELKEVEAVVREFRGIKDATVQAFDDESGSGKFIAAYIVSDSKVDVEALNNFILERKPPYMVPAVTMQIDRIPLNQNQKVNKRALPKPEKKNNAELQSAANMPLNVLEQELHELIASVINTKDFGITTVLGYAGLTSISAIRLAVLVNKRYGVAVDAKTLVKSGTLQSIENEILHVMLNGQLSEQGETAAPSSEKIISAALSYAQTGIYFECLKNPTSTIYNIPYLLSFPSTTDAEQLAEAVKRVIQAHPELGAHFTTEGSTIVQTLQDSAPIEVVISEMSDDDLTTYKHDFVRPFNLQKPPLYRFEVVKTGKGVYLLMDVHHLVFDGGSADLFIRQIGTVLDGQSIEDEDYTYLDFVCDQQKAEESDTFRASAQFFAERLATCEGASEIPADLPKSDRQGIIGEAVCPIDHDEVATACRGQEITPAHLFLAAVAYVVARYTNNREVYLSTVSSGRSNLKIADTVGMFVNTLALGINVDDISVSEFLRQTADTFDQTLRHEDYSFARIAADYGFHPAIAFAYQVGVLSQYTVGGQSIGMELLELNVPKFKINIKIESRGIVVQYDDSLYSDRLAKGLAESIAHVVELMSTMPEAKVRGLSIVSPNQEENLSHLRQTAVGEAPFKLFHECISHFSQTQPDHEALVACDATFTYKEMDECTNRIANGLRQRGVCTGDRVALLLPRTSRLILSLFGVLKAGAAYIPCDPDYPADRVKLILDDSKAKLIITPEVAEELLQTPDSTLPEVGVTGDDLAYLIYTSGSTGRPKGVMLRHAGICNYLYGHPANVFAHAVLTDATRVLSVTTISFDAALQDIGMAFYNGKTLIIATEEQANNPLQLSQLINEQHIDMVSGTPSRWQTWLTSENFADAIAKVKICRAGGEKFSDQLLTIMRSITRARIFNCYGPTEITVASNNAELTHSEMVTVGKPQLNVKEFIVDSDGNELPVGVVGELYIGGKGVARGYNNLDDMTRERFVSYHGERVYKSGDYAKWQPDGNVVILGRTDHQIKLRGLRIELGEIENVMLRVAGIKKVAILIRTLNGKDHLCAYYTADREIAPDALKAEISKSLTQYMVPTAYLQLGEMPMTPNGKTDVKALPEPQLAVTSAYVAPANETEQTFCDIFADILQMDKVGATDNFFELGGTSLIVTRVIIEADKAGMHVAYGDVFSNPTPRLLARLVTGDIERKDGTSDPIADYDYTAINILLQHNTISTYLGGKRERLGNVMLTGATGYLGIHILHEFIESDAEHIYCLVRAKSQDDAERRLKTLLFYYFDNTYEGLLGERLHVVVGDVTNDLCQLLDGYTIHTVFNCAAVVKHFSEGTEIEDVNIGGAERCINYCLNSGARLIHVSTASTRGLWAGEAKPDVFTEQRLYMGQFLGNKYIYSKFMAERLILDAVAQHGLHAKIMRVGNLAARSTDGEFQANFRTNSFMGRIRVYNMLGCCPHAMRNRQVEFSPINEVAHAIALLATTPRECTVFHPYNIHGQFLGDVLTQLTSVGDGIRFVEQDEFQSALDAAATDPQKANQLSSLLAYQDMAHGQKTTDVKRDNDYTTQVLYRLGFAWSPTSWDYVDRMLTAISGFGFFD